VSATSHGAGCGIVLGIVFVLLAQQLSYISLSDLVPAIIDLVIAMVVGAIIFGVIGWALGRLYLHRHPVAGGPPPPS